MNPLTLNLDSTGIKLVSFDVFDTVIARKCGAPETIFRITGEKLRELGWLALPAHEFARMRVDAEQRVRQHANSGEITLAQIYAELNRLWFFSETMLRAMLECELQTERENLFVIPGAFALVEQARQAGKRIAFVSDMYLPAGFLRAVLTDLDLLRDGDGLYVSSQWGVSKAGGGLFLAVLEQEKLAGNEVLHLGDSLYSDVKRARESDIQARQITCGSLNRFEAALARAEAEMFDETGRLAGLARHARLKVEDTGGHLVAARLGASLAGPILAAYAEWVLRAARSRNLKRLYFLARDGQALLRVCEMLVSAVGAGQIELKYLYGSREIWSPAALASLDETAAAFFAVQVAWTASTWEHCIEYLGFAIEEIKRTSLPAKWASARGGTDWKKQIFLDLAADPVLGPVLRRRLQEKSSLAARYLSEQGLADSVPCGLVDCGWSGTWTDIIGDLVEGQGGARPLVLFLGRRRRTAPARCETLAWMFDHQSGGGLKTIPNYFHVVVEFLLTADHGRTVGFEETDGRLHPKLAAVDWQGFTPESWWVFRRALLAFAEAYAQQLQPAREMTDLRPTLNELVRLFWEQPTVAEARFFSGHTIGLSPVRANTQPLARPYRWPDAVRLALRGQLPGYLPFWWHEGALALSGSTLRKSMALMWETRECLRRLRDAGKSGLEPKRLAHMLAASARKLKHGLEQREDSGWYRFESNSIQPKLQTGPLGSLAVTASSGTTIS